ncbi:PilZ domain-containing protein [Microvirga sp. VF16]|uniref:PilZ domain-containing protein n=1 Tax=Microvirga sp. VF16 TaxID=2807101 RepID=UPI00193E4B43|nr:PilZ domain-containing protein [Microvirga sp. VF16]
MMSDRRRYCRRESALRATATSCDGATTFQCHVQNITAGGAKLTFATAVDLPHEFELEIPQLALNVEARMVWREGEECGVTFIWPQQAGYR